MSRNMGLPKLVGASLSSAPTSLLRGVATPSTSRPLLAFYALSSRAIQTPPSRRTFITSNPYRNNQPSRFRRANAPPPPTDPATSAPSPGSPGHPPAPNAQPTPNAQSPPTSTVPPPPGYPAPPYPGHPGAVRRPRVNVNSKEYKQFAGRWLRLVVGLPFAIVLSWILYKRLSNPIDPEEEEKIRKKRLEAFPRRA
ncbi:hypothetical protein VTJ04DRAFT_7256 [Mycothermus thermophilus]|uniref:uncharacterized protein n=1 Tax=Humicola insolens TaxID=85995 RepID=UPI003744A715